MIYVSMTRSSEARRPMCQSVRVGGAPVPEDYIQELGKMGVVYVVVRVDVASVLQTACRVGGI